MRAELSVRLVALGAIFFVLVFQPSTVSARPVKSLLEMRQQGVVVQQWDISCGAAVLATILNYQYGDPISEREVALGLISREEYVAQPELVRAREGFSLLDLKRFVDARGYEGIGLAKLTLSDLVELAPIVVSVKTKGFRHFVVFRGMMRDRVLLADPAFGNTTMLRHEFEEVWFDHGELGRIGFRVLRADGSAPPGWLAPRPEEFVSFR